jgi:hypothetical protein
MDRQGARKRQRLGLRRNSVWDRSRIGAERRLRVALDRELALDHAIALGYVVTEDLVDAPEPGQADLDGDGANRVGTAAGGANREAAGDGRRAHDRLVLA